LQCLVVSFEAVCVVRMNLRRVDIDTREVKQRDS
jgi:hypothetical protein